MQDEQERGADHRHDDARRDGSHGGVAQMRVGGPLPERGALLAGLLLLVAATLVSGGFLLHATDLHLPASSEPWDAAIYPWNFFWTGASFTADDGSILFTRRFFWPAGEGLGLYTPTYVYSVLSLPFQWLLHAPESRHVAVAFLLWFSSVATALLAYRLARELGLTRPGALFVALLALVASGRLMNAARLNLFCTEFLLFYFWSALTFWKRGGAARGALVGFAASLLLLQSQPLFFQGGLATLLVGAALLTRRATRAQFKERLGPLVGACVVFLVLCGPFLWEMVRELPHSPAVEQALGMTQPLSLDASDLVLPSTIDRFVGWTSKLLPTRPPSLFEEGGPLGTVSHFLGLGWLALLAIALVARDGGTGRKSLWLALALLAFAVGPVLSWRGQPITYAPWVVLQLAPWLAIEKSPTRLVWLVELFAAIAAARAFEWLAFDATGKRRRLGVPLAGALALLTLAEQGETVPLRSCEPRIKIPPEIAALAHEPGNFAVLDLPYDSGPLSDQLSHCVNGLAMAFGAAHERSIFFGLYPRAARPREPELAARALFSTLRRCEMLPPGAPLPELSAGDLAAIHRDLAELSIGAVLVHDVAFDPERFPGGRQHLRELMRRLAPKSETPLQPGVGYTVTLFRF